MYRIIIVHIQTIKSVTKGAQCCCLISLGSCKHRDAGLHSGKVGRDTPPLAESPLSPLLFLHNSAPLISASPHPIYPFRAWADTALIFSSTGQVSQNVMTCSGKVLVESQRHPVLHYLRPFNLCLWMETT